MKKIFLPIFLLAAFAGVSQKHLYPKKIFANHNAVYLTNSKSEKDLSFLYRTPSDTNQSLFLIRNVKLSDIQSLVDNRRFKNLEFCPNNYITRIGDLVFSITSEKTMIYFFHYADKNSPVRKIN